MSGCHIPNCLSPCCKDLLDKIRETERRVNVIGNSYTKEFYLLEERLNSLGHSQAEILSKHLEKIEKLENSPFGKSPTYAPLFDRLNKLEDAITVFSNWKNAIEILQMKIDRLEQSREAQSRSNKQLFERLDKLEGKKAKKMIECPACKGSGENHQKMVADMDYQIAKKGDVIIRISTCTVCGGNQKIESI